MKQSGYVLLYLLLWLPTSIFAQSPDSLLPGKDTLRLVKDTSSIVIQVRAVRQYDTALKDFLYENKLMNTSPAVSRISSIRHFDEKNYLFYLIVGMVLLLGCLKFFYNRYFSNLFRVFFNSSLRQSQLTDQLLQARLPSLLFNVFFVISTGFFVYLLLVYFHWLDDRSPWFTFLPGCIACIGIIYAVKYFTLRFTGWITSYKESIDTYIFVIFLINKIIGVLLVPVIVIMAFGELWLVRLVILPALVTTGLLIVLRFFRSYGLLQGRIKVSRFHFFLYVIGIELLPILVIYKALMLYLNKSI